MPEPEFVSRMVVEVVEVEVEGAEAEAVVVEAGAGEGEEALPPFQILRQAKGERCSSSTHCYSSSKHYLHSQHR